MYGEVDICDRSLVLYCVNRLASVLIRPIRDTRGSSRGRRGSRRGRTHRYGVYRTRG
jgi:hypothetical protein